MVENMSLTSYTMLELTNVILVKCSTNEFKHSTVKIHSTEKGVDWLQYHSDMLWKTSYQHVIK